MESSETSMATVGLQLMRVITTCLFGDHPAAIPIVFHVVSLLSLGAIEWNRILELTRDIQGREVMLATAGSILQ